MDGLTELFTSNASTDTSTQQDTVNIQRALKDPTIGGVGRDMLQQVEALKGGRDGVERRVLLILDQPDFLLAVTEDEIGAVKMMSMIMDLREVSVFLPTQISLYVDLTAALVQNTQSMVVTLAADSPLTQSPSTPLETQHSTLLVTLAHQASYVMSLRLLDTGTARDISGVMRVTLGPDNGDGERAGVEERELLYFVGGDGGVKVFERGSEGHS